MAHTKTYDMHQKQAMVMEFMQEGYCRDDAEVIVYLQTLPRIEQNEDQDLVVLIAGVSGDEGRWLSELAAAAEQARAASANASSARASEGDGGRGYVAPVGYPVSLVAASPGRQYGQQGMIQNGQYGMQCQQASYGASYTIDPTRHVQHTQQQPASSVPSSMIDPSLRSPQLPNQPAFAPQLGYAGGTDNCPTYGPNSGGTRNTQGNARQRDLPTANTQSLYGTFQSGFPGITSAAGFGARGPPANGGLARPSEGIGRRGDAAPDGYPVALVASQPDSHYGPQGMVQNGAYGNTNQQASSGAPHPFDLARAVQHIQQQPAGNVSQLMIDPSHSLSRNSEDSLFVSQSPEADGNNNGPSNTGPNIPAHDNEWAFAFQFLDNLGLRGLARRAAREVAIEHARHEQEKASRANAAYYDANQHIASRRQGNAALNKGFNELGGFRPIPGLQRHRLPQDFDVNTILTPEMGNVQLAKPDGEHYGREAQPYRVSQQGRPLSPGGRPLHQCPICKMWKRIHNFRMDANICLSCHDRSSQGHMHFQQAESQQDQGLKRKKSNGPTSGLLSRVCAQPKCSNTFYHVSFKNCDAHREVHNLRDKSYNQDRHQKDGDLDAGKQVQCGRKGCGAKFGKDGVYSAKPNTHKYRYASWCKNCSDRYDIECKRHAKPAEGERNGEAAEKDEDDEDDEEKEAKRRRRNSF